MNFKIDPNIPYDWKQSFQEFENLYGAQLSALYPCIANQSIDVSVLDSMEFVCDNNNPIQANEDINSLYYSPNTLSLSLEHREALIAHEIGHLIHKGRYEGQQLEIECDRVASDLKINSSLKDALIILRDNYCLYISDPFLHEWHLDKINKTIELLNQRIDLL